MTGILSIVRESLILFLPNADITRQQEIFWSCIRIAFIGSLLIAWWSQYRKANRLSKLDIEVKDIFLTYIRPLGEWNDNNARTFLTVVFSITNPESAPNTIKNCRLILYMNQKFFIKTNKVEFEKRDAPFLKDGETGRRSGHLNTASFQQGLPQDYAASFEVDKSDIADKPFVVYLVDSYNKQYKKRDRTPKNLMETLVRFHF